MRENMKITKEWVHANKTCNGGWTARQLKSIGVKWPPVKGWVESIEGNEVSDKNAAIFSLDAGKKITK